MTNNQTISVLGCGWLGLPLAQRLVQLGYSVNGSTTSQGKLARLKASGVNPYLLTADSQLHGQDTDAFFQSDVLFLNIPFRRSLKNPDDYRRQIESVIAAVESSPVSFVVFAGSTSIYPASMNSAAEGSIFTPDNPRSKILFDVEQLLKNNKHFQTTILRFAGLYGGERKIGRIMAGKTNVADADSPVNLIHLEDCIEIVVRIIQKKISGEIFNACSDGHPSRLEIYTKAAEHYGLEPPQFNDQSQTRFKKVDNSKLKEKLNYIFRHPDPMRFG